jgi:hypothetical protein
MKDRERNHVGIRIVGMKRMNIHKVQAMRQQNWYSEAGWRVCYSSRLGVSQEEVQKKPQLGTTQ